MKQRNKYLPGQRVNNYTLISLFRKNNIPYWYCLCDCGKSFERRACVIKHTFSCGCHGRKQLEKSNNMRKQLIQKRKKTVHHLYKTGYYSTWQLAEMFNLSQSTIWSYVKK